MSVKVGGRGDKNRENAVHAVRIVHLITSDLRVSGVLTVRDNKDIHSCRRASYSVPGTAVSLKS